MGPLNGHQGMCGYLKRYNRTLTPFTVRELNPPVTGTSCHESLATTFTLLNSREMFLSSNFGLYFKLFCRFSIASLPSSWFPGYGIMPAVFVTVIDTNTYTDIIPNSPSCGPSVPST